MDNIKLPVYLTTFVLFVYIIISQIYPDPYLMVGIFTVSPFLVIWMVYSVLKYGKPYEKTFDEYFYCDSDKKRLPVKEQTERPEHFNP